MELVSRWGGGGGRDSGANMSCLYIYSSGSNKVFGSVIERKVGADDLLACSSYSILGVVYGLSLL